MKSALALAALALLTGCDVLSGPDFSESRQVAALVLSDPYTETLSAPDTVVAGVPFEITVLTVGGGCVKLGDTELSVEPQMAELRPYDRVLTPRGENAACTLELTYLPHTVLVTFSEPGRAVVRAVGVSYLAPVEGIATSDPVEVEKAVTVVAR